MGLTLRPRSADTDGVRDPIKLVVGRFEDLIAHGLRSLLAEDSNVEVIATDVEIEALDALLGDQEPTVALINFGSRRTPVEVNRLRLAHPQTRLVVLANRPTPSECNQMLAFGATACLSKETQARDILNAIHLASRGLHVLPRSDAEDQLGPELLTPREADVLEHLRAGRSNAEIALALSVSVETIRTHRRNIYRKLGVRTRRELASLTQS